MKIRMFSIILAGTLLYFVNLGQAESGQRKGFSFQDPTLPLEDILNGGPPRDLIPSIESPKFISSAEVDWLLQGSRVLGLELNSFIRDYPLAILHWHEIVNDSVGGVPLAGTYCPLSGSGMAFRSDFSGTITTLGVSGLLYNSDFLLYDRESELLWSQVMGQSVSVLRKGERLITVLYRTHCLGRLEKSASSNRSPLK
jgi:hypothetical protein